MGVDIEDLLVKYKATAAAKGESKLCFFVNGKKFEFRSIDPEKTVIEFLRENYLTGTKLGCAEGGCGACTVVVSSFDPMSKKLVHRPINSCLATVASLHGCAVTTVEGLAEAKGSNVKTLHPIQQAMADSHASQCGFCTPGIIMSMYAMWLTHGNNLTAHAVEEGLDGNLCRCTGYRPITNTLHGLADALNGTTKAEENLEHHHHHDHDHDHECQGKNEETNICNRTGVSCTGTCHSNLEGLIPSLSIEWAGRLQNQQNQTFEKLPMNGPGPLYLCGDHLGEEVEWFAPRSLEELSCVTRAHVALGKNYRIAMGNSERRVEKLFKSNHTYPLSLVTPANVIEMKGMSFLPEAFDGQGALELGCAAPIHDLEQWLKTLASEWETSGKQLDRFRATLPRAYANQMKWFAGRQVRNAASLGGNIVTASPISDLNALHMAADAILTIARFDEETGALVTREAKLADGFFVGYRKVDMKPEEIAVKVTIPLPRMGETLFAFKQCRRKEDDIAIVNAALRTRLDLAAFIAGEAPSPTIVEAVAFYGGMGPTPKKSVVYSEAAQGQAFDHALVAPLAAAVLNELRLPANVPGGMPDYRNALAGSFVVKNFFQIIDLIVNDMKLGNESGALHVLAGDDAARIMSTVVHHPTNKFSPPPVEGLKHKHHRVPADPATGLPDYSKIADFGGVGAPAKHVTADAQVAGEAKYVDDYPPLPGEIHLALITSKMARARIVSVSDSRARLEAPGYIGMATHVDVPGEKRIGSVLPDEDVFAVNEVFAVGQVIGVVASETPLGARLAAALIEIEYSTEGVEAPCLTIDDAIQRKKFYDMAPSMPGENKMELYKYPGKDEGAPVPDWDDVFAKFAADPERYCVVDGEAFIGGQEHFYLETHGCRVSIGENQEMVIDSSSQNPSKNQMLASKVTGIPRAKITVTTKRLGGGFGGKETRACYYSAYAAVAALKFGRPVRLILDRDVDMQTSGQRNAFKSKYRVAVDRKTLKLQAVDITGYCSAGWSTDLSVPVSERCIFHMDNAYVAPYFHAQQYVCQTNISSNTAFRGFGGPQGMYFAEQYMEKAARTMGVDVFELKRANLYRKGDTTHYNVPEQEDNLPEVVDRVISTSEFERRKAEVAAFNAANKFHKRALAVTPVKFGMSFSKLFMNQGGALVHLYQDGTILVSHGGVEMGQGLHTKVAQVVATAFDVPLSCVHIGTTSTDKVANTQPTAASVGADLYAAAAKLAADEIMERMAPFIADAKASFLKANPEVTAETLSPLNKKTILGVAASTAHFSRINMSATGFYATPISGWNWPKKTGQPFFYSSFGCAVAEVELDTLTGDHTTIRVDALHDTGATLNPACDIGQVEGAFVQGMGLFTLEELVRMPGERGQGAMFTKGPGTYKIPGFGDMPKDFRVELLNKPTVAKTVHSSKGVGEPPLFLAHSVAAAMKECVHEQRKEFARSLSNAQSGVSAEVVDLLLEYAGKYIRIDSPFTAEKARIACWDALTVPMDVLKSGDLDKVRSWLETTLEVRPTWNLEV